jgi:hypothetical protein
MSARGFKTELVTSGLDLNSSHSSWCGQSFEHSGWYSVSFDFPSSRLHIYAANISLPL